MNKELEAKGISPVRVDVDVKDLFDWCQRNGRPLDGSARASYVAERTRTDTGSP
jgi:hypothetical protein